MSNLVVVGFDEPHKADEVCLKLQMLQSEYLLDLEDVVVAVNDEKGKVKLHQAGNLIADGAICGGFCGSLTGLIFLNAAEGAASGALTDVGISHHFMKELTATLIPGSSALFEPGQKSDAGQGQGTGRAEGNRRQNLEDLTFA